MTEEELMHEASELGRWQQHRFMVLVAATIAASLLLVIVALWLYNTSGAAQLDLSRPGYQSVRDKIEHDNDFGEFSSSGEINDEVLEEFRTLYDKQLKEATTVESFGGNVMDDDSLGIDAPNGRQ